MRGRLGVDDALVVTRVPAPRPLAALALPAGLLGAWASMLLFPAHLWLPGLVAGGVLTGLATLAAQLLGEPPARVVFNGRSGLLE